MSDWRYRAACRGEDPELFYPVGTTGPALDQLADAKSVCRRCPVNTDCLAWALDSGQEHGVWGGMSEDERRALTGRRARRSPTRCDETVIAALVAGRIDAKDATLPEREAAVQRLSNRKPTPTAVEIADRIGMKPSGVEAMRSRLRKRRDRERAA